MIFLKKKKIEKTNQRRGTSTSQKR